MAFLTRSRQFIFAKVMGQLPYRQELLVGEEKLLDLPKILVRDQILHVFVMTTPGMIKRGSLSDFFEGLNRNGISYTTFTSIQPDPTTDNVLEAKEACRKRGTQAIVAIGGGSVLDCAKIAGACIANLNFNPNSPSFLSKPLPPFYAVPTTAGSGSEITAGAVITKHIDGKHIKTPINDLRLVPKTVILDPVLTTSLPSSLTISSGMDAVSHVIEAYTNKFASRKTRIASETAFPLLINNIELAVKEPQNMQARENLLVGSYQAGLAITTNFVGYIHAISHAIGGRYGLTHGVINSQLMPLVLRHYGDAITGPLAKLADTIQVGRDLEPREKAKLVIERLENLRERFGISGKIAELSCEDFPDLIKQAISEANPAYPVPVIWDYEDFEDILTALLLA